MKVPCLNVVLQKLYCLTTGTVYVILKSMSIDPTDNLPEPSMVKVDKYVHTQVSMTVKKHRGIGSFKTTPSNGLRGSQCGVT